MAAPTEVYVDPSIAADSGTGTIGDPYGDLQYALDTMSRDAANGNRINIKAGTDEILTAAISLTGYGTPSAGAPLIFQGYTAVAEDHPEFGSQPGIDGDGTYSIINSVNRDYIYFADLHLHNSGSADIIRLDDHCAVLNCHVENSSGIGIYLDQRAQIMGCHIQKVASSVEGVRTGFASTIENNFFKSETHTPTQAISTNSNDTRVIGNIISISGSTIGINVTGRSSVLHNSILSNAGTGKGIECGAATQYFSIRGNLIEGFSGVGGSGFGFASQSDYKRVTYNASYNNTTDYNDSGRDFALFDVDNESLGASPFAKSGADTFANRFTYFAPADTGNVIGGMPNGQDKGAVQSAASGGSGGGIRLIGKGGLVA